ncbi:MAG: hypothetical protein WC558_10230, partial [Patulibacter sp.]
PADGDDAAVVAAAGPGTTDGTGGGAAPAPTTDADYELASATGAVTDSRLVGIAILAALFAAAGFVFLFGLVRRRALRPTP